MIQLKKTFEDILDHAYPDSEKLDAYKRVYVETINKNMKSRHGDYNKKTKHIRIFNLYRSDASLAATSIHELAHHVDCCNRGKSDHSKEFYEVFEVLLTTALNMGIFTVDEFLESHRDASDSNKIAMMLERYVPEPIDYKKDTVILSVSGGFDQKDRLKAKGYSWNPGLKTWDKEISDNDVEEEQTYLATLRLHGEVRDAGKLSMSRGTCIVAGKGSFDIRDILKQEGFSFQSTRKIWTKPGDNSELLKYKSRYPNVEWSMEH